MGETLKSAQIYSGDTNWAKKLLRRPLVEIRRGLSLGYEPPREDSSVLALTAPSGKFVDIRFALSPCHESAIVSRAENFSGYATAGLSIAEILPGTDNCPPYECTVHVQWQHPIDSSHKFSTDAADMYLLANGDVMEIGMVEIEGKMHMFKEYWIGPKEDARQLPCVVIETKGRPDGQGQKGMVVRIGDFCQGIYQDVESGLFWVERWEAGAGAGPWAKHIWSNTNTDEDAAVLPCKWAIEEKMKIGASIILDGRIWEVTELFEG